MAVAAAAAHNHDGPSFASSWLCSNQCFGQLSYRLPGPAT